VANLMYELSVPVMLKGLNNLVSILDKAAQHSAEKKFDASVLLSARLYPDMFALTRQVQIATDQAKGAAARLAGLPVPKYEDTETSIDELKARLQKTIDFLNTVHPEQMQGAETRDITLPLREPLQMKGLPYLQSFVLPNFFFHCMAAYTILRHNGVPVGKMDFLGKL
jgi:uncharacterized protein